MWIIINLPIIKLYLVMCIIKWVGVKYARRDILHGVNFAQGLTFARVSCQT